MNKITSTILAAVLAFQLASPLPARAAAGAASWPVGAPLMVTGGITAAAGAAAIVTAISIYDADDWVIAGLWVFGLGAMIAGIIMLDETGTVPRYEPVSEQQGRALSLTPMEIEEYNASVDEINAAAESVARELKRAEKPSMELSRQLWERYRTRLSSEAAFTGAGKVSAHWLNGVRKAPAKP